jgi:hypothetical protein
MQRKEHISHTHTHMHTQIHMYINLRTNIKVKQSLHRPGQQLSIPEGWGSQISRQSVYKSGKVVSFAPRPPFPPPPPQEIFLVLISVRGWVNPRAIVLPEGLLQWKFSMTQRGIEPATFRFIAQCLNKLRHRRNPWNDFLRPETVTYGNI